MANRFVDSVGGGNNAPYETKGDAAISLAVLDDVVAAGETIFVSHLHRGTLGSSQVFDFVNSTLASPVIIKSINFTGDAYLRGGRETTTSSGDITFNGHGLRVFGIDLYADDDYTLGAGGSESTYFEDCEFIGTSSSTWSFGLVESYTRYINCVFTTTNAGVPFNPSAESTQEFISCTFNHVSTTFINEVDNSRMVFQGCDFPDTDNLTNGITSQGRIEFILRDCKINSSFSALGAGTIERTPVYISIENCSSSTSLALPLPGGITEKHTYQGNVSDDDTHFRTGGSDDEFNGEYSRKMTTLGVAIEQYEALDSGDLTKPIGTNTSPSSATTQSIYTTTRMSIQGSPVELSTKFGSDSSSWTGADTGTKYKLTHTLVSESAATLTVYIATNVTLNDDDFWIEINEPDQVGGELRVNAFLALASTTVYVDIKLDTGVTDGFTYSINGVAVTERASASTGTTIITRPRRVM